MWTVPDDEEDLSDLDDGVEVETRGVGPEEDAGIEPVLCDDAAPDELGGDLGDGQVFRLRVVDGELDDEGARPVVDPVHLLEGLLCVANIFRVRCDVQPFL